jgi:hypothetical protein
MLEEAQPEHPLVRQLRFELEALRALPPKGTEIASDGTLGERSAVRDPPAGSTGGSPVLRF